MMKKLDQLFFKSISKLSFSVFQNKCQLETDVLKEPIPGQEVTFKIKKSTLGRIGWKIIPEDDTLNLKMNQDILTQVLERIRYVDFIIIKLKIQPNSKNYVIGQAPD